MTHRFPEAGQRTAVFAGSFNPFTVGHLSILKRGLEIFDKVIVMIGHNASKKDDSENAEKRVEELSRLLAPFGERTEVRICSGLVAPEAKALGAVALLRAALRSNKFLHCAGTPVLWLRCQIFPPLLTFINR